MKKWRLILTLFIALGMHTVQAQEQLLLVANEYLNNKDYPKATELFQKLYSNNPLDKSIAEKYYLCLIGSSEYAAAEKLVKTLLKQSKADPQYNLMLANLYLQTKEDNKAEKILDKMVEDNCTSDQLVRTTALLFEVNKLHSYSIAIYELARKKSGNNLAYAEELATLYDNKGDFELATDALLDLAVKDQNKIDNVKTTLLRLFQSEEKVDATRRKIIKRINAEPDVVVYPDILAWLYMQQNDYDEAFTQFKAIDIRLAEKGKRVLNFARIATKEKRYEIANDAYNYVLDQGKTEPHYFVAYADKVSSMRTKLIGQANYTTKDVDTVLNAYEQYFIDNVYASKSETVIEYAMLLARFAKQHKKAIDVLNTFANDNAVSALSKGKAKLDLGDYHLIDNNYWEASLTYSQVDKTFKNDMLGEEARFRNAKLSYYIHDYTWAQGQLDILKASTSELIANDALNLSVLITENTPFDSNFAPLNMFANADLLLFQNKTDTALLTLDSIAKIYPENALVDDVLLMRGKVALRQKEYMDALKYFTQVYTSHKEDVLADDALYQAAQLEELYLDHKSIAKDLYEKIILDYPGSSFVTEARKAYRRLRGDKLEDS
jgi:predicted Zn-dependent protease